MHTPSLSLSLSLSAKCFSLLLLISLSASHLKAQVRTPGTEFITETEKSLDDLTTGQMSNYNKAIGKETVVSTKFVQLDDLASIQHDGVLDLKHPDKECTAKVKAKHVESYPSGDFYWYGEVETQMDENGKEQCDCSVGYVDIMKREGRVIGTISIDDDFYELEDLGTGTSLLAKVVDTGLGYKCGMDEGDSGGDGNGSVSERGDGNCPVHVLALYTPNVKDAVSNIEDKITLEINKANQGLRNSKVQDGELELVLVDMQEFDFYDGPSANGGATVISTDMSFVLRQGNFGYWDDIDALRTAAAADIVVLYSNADYGNNLGVSGTQTLTSDNAICIVQAPKGLGKFVTAHEIGHLIGCYHEPGHSSNPSNATYQHGHIYISNLRPHSFCGDNDVISNTIMFSSSEHKTLGYYSNPNVKHKGEALGVVGERENWRVLKENGCTVAGFKSSGDDSALSVSWTAPYDACNCQELGITTSVSGGGVGAYAFRWYTSTDGFNWGNPIGSGSSISLMVPGGCPNPPLDYIFVKLEVESGDGQIVTKTRRIEAVDQIPGDPSPCRDMDDRSSSVFENEQKESISIYPNPVSERLTVELFGYENEHMPIEIFDALGKRVFFKNLHLQTDKESASFDLSSLLAGTYSVKIDKKEVKKIVKTSDQ